MYRLIENIQNNRYIMQYIEYIRNCYFSFIEKYVIINLLVYHNVWNSILNNTLNDYRCML